jgi:signal transducing adaptor molecule
MAVCGVQSDTATRTVFTFIPHTMFSGATPSEYDDIVSEYLLHRSQIIIDFKLDKTTDENLTSENWELILNLCDKVQDEGQTG